MNSHGHVAVMHISFAATVMMRCLFQLQSVSSGSHQHCSGQMVCAALMQVMKAVEVRVTVHVGWQRCSEPQHTLFRDLALPGVLSVLCCSAPCRACNVVLCCRWCGCADG